MTRNTAREIAAHLAYEWNFTDLPVGEFLDRRLAQGGLRCTVTEKEEA